MTTTRPSGYGVDYARRALAICWFSPVLGDLGARCTMTRPAREESA